ncbi:AAA family ATPase [Thalassospira alkalitolerans]|uniref:ATPase AAA-type core domain-containing protein n=1 Tax=Thalassospira alkalitolerans TaxID=1293890 RepID=A0A1Y2L898_9PROT|nr:ATP-binding protein [Thalassospira alkalitolerans]OSQ46204.1 hypothetical protein TALK_16455 [Thalassospira alkalitolerans]
MLVEFSVSNYLSFAERQTFSMVAGKGAASRETHSMESGNSFAPHILRSAGIFGPNGAGKSNFVSALGFFSDFVMNSSKDYTEGDTIPVSSFHLDPRLKDEPSEFEILFVSERGLYQYGFSATEDRVWDEWLFCRPNERGTRIRKLFQRAYDPDLDEYRWDLNEGQLKGQREVWREATRYNALFLSTAVQLNSEVLLEPYGWISKFLRVICSPNELSYRFSAKKCLDADFKDLVLKFLQSSDVRISDIRVEEKEFEIPSNIENGFTPIVIDEIKKKGRNSKSYEIFVSYKDIVGNDVYINFDMESTGTQALFSLAGPWLDVLEKGYTLIVDELNSSLHPLALQHLIKMFHDPDLNKKGAQVIFTCHDTNTLSDWILAKDQIWFVEKRDENSSHVFPLSDFEIRDLGSFQKGYLKGRFGAVPRIKEF